MSRSDPEPLSQTPDPFSAWIFMIPEFVPPEWKDRAREVSLVPLLPAEARRILHSDDGASEIRSEDLPLVDLIASGATIEKISKELGMDRRSVQRRLGRLRQALGLETKGELAVYLARRGFGSAAKGGGSLSQGMPRRRRRTEQGSE